MIRIRIGICFAILLCFCVSCGKAKNVKQQKKIQIYYVNAEETELGFELYQPKQTRTKAVIAECLKRMQEDPKNLSYKKAKPDHISLNRFTWDEKQKQLTLEFDHNYMTLKGTSEVLSRAAIVKTLCQIAGVEEVAFLVNGQPLMQAGTTEKPVGFMSEQNFVEETENGLQNKRSVPVTLFFANQKRTGLLKVQTKQTDLENMPLERFIIKKLIEGPANVLKGKEQIAYPVLSKKTKLQKMMMKDGICYIDFNEAFLHLPNKISQKLAVYAVVNSLVEATTTIHKVRISVDGQQVRLDEAETTEHGFFERNLDIVEDRL